MTGMCSTVLASIFQTRTEDNLDTPNDTSGNETMMPRRRSPLKVAIQTATTASGTLFEGDASAPEVSLRDEAVLAFPGDEDANGQWMSVIDNPDGAIPGLLNRFRMTVTSRYDCPTSRTAERS